MKTEFQLYQEKDRYDLARMIVSLYTEDPEGQPISPSKIDRTIEEFQKHPEKIRIYMFKDGEENIGYAFLVFFWSNEYGGDILTIDELYVKEAYRGNGAATEFFHFIETFENIAAFQLETTPSNQRAFAYYQRLGFAPDQNAHLMKCRP